jgi:argininosuccinate lyase
MFVQVHEAWLLMLVQQGIVPAERGERILRALDEVGPAAIDEMIRDWDPSGWEPMMQLERYLTARVGQIASDLNIARTIPPPFYRMELAILLVELIEATLSFRRILLDNASRHVETVMPGYTHLQHAQPMTYGHYLLGLYDAIDRAASQVEAAYSNTNRFELGCGALSGTSFKIDRQLPARLLGFDGLVEHSNDAVAATDFIVDILAALINLMIPLSRVANEMDIWSSFEFNMIELSDHLANPSSMMPQKKNPVIFEFCRMALGEILGGMSEVVCAAHALPYGDVIEMRELAFSVQPKIAEVIKQLHIMGEGLATLKINRALMLARAREGFSTVTELAALLYLEANVPLRVAHGIVAEVVRATLAAGRSASQITPEVVAAAAAKVTGAPVSIEAEQLERALDPESFVRSHCSQGGVAPVEAQRMIDARTDSLAQAVRRHEERLERRRAARRELEARVAAALGRKD